MDVLWSICTEFVTLRWLLINSIISIVIYQLVFKKWSYFNENNVKFLRGVPLLGAQWRFCFFRESVSDSIKRMYNLFANEKLFGVFDIGGNPVYILRDPEIIKQIAIKDFDHFMNHRSFGNAEPLLSRTLFAMKDQPWKNMRSSLSPAFTGSKMRLMFSLIGDVSNTFCDHLKNEMNENGGEIVCDIRQKFGCFTNDAIASCAFGINIDSIKDENNEFYKIGRSLINFSGFKTTLKFIGMLAMPKLMKFFEITIFDKSTTTFFRQIVKENMEYREKNDIVRNDMINLLMQMKKGTLADNETEKEIDGDIGFATVQEVSLGKVSAKQKWDDDDLTAQSMIFFVAGFNAVSMTLSFLAYDLAAHPDIQDKLYQEIHETEEQLNGKPLTYETLQKMKYLDMVLSESMRMWTQAPTSDRIVNKQYELEMDDHKIIFNPGDVVVLPTFGLHHDAKYFPNPEKFNPERFSDENKDKIVPGTYLPFGIGPRNCIASRFALMESKACIFHLLSNCKIEMSSKMQHPIKLKKGTISIEPEGGFWLKLKPRQ